MGPFFAANVSSTAADIHWRTAVVTVQIARHSLDIGKVRRPEAKPVAQRKQALCLPSDAADWQLDFSAGARLAGPGRVWSSVGTARRASGSSRSMMAPVRFICLRVYLLASDGRSPRCEQKTGRFLFTSRRSRCRGVTSSRQVQRPPLHTPPQFRPSCDCALRNAAQEGQAVEFEVILDEKGRKKAVAVSGAHPIGDFGERSSAEVIPLLHHLHQGWGTIALPHLYH